MILHIRSGNSNFESAWRPVAHLNLFMNKGRTVVDWLRTGLLAICVIIAMSGFAEAEAQEVAEEPFALQSQVFIFKDGGKAPSYTLRFDEGSTPDVIIFFISGSGCASVKHRLAPFFAPIRKSMNAVVFSLQKRAIDEEDRTGAFCSQSFHTTDYVEKTIADQREFIESQLATASPKPKAVVLLGASEGAVVAAKIAASDSRVTHVGLIGGGGTTMRENLKVLSKTTWYLRSPDNSFAAIANDPENTISQVWGHSYKYWASLLDINIGDELITLDIPIVAAMGEKDEAVPLESAQELQTRFNKSSKSNLLLLVFPNANHRLEDKDNAKSYAKDFLMSLVRSIGDKPTERTIENDQQRVAPVSRTLVTGDVHDE